MPNYGNPKYWDERYKEQQNTMFDWQNKQAVRLLIIKVSIMQVHYSLIKDFNYWMRKCRVQLKYV